MGSLPNEVTSLVDTETYKTWRSNEINELELSVWTADMFKYGISSSYESYGSLKTAIRRGVPDIIKHYIWIKANGADRFYAEHPNFYRHSFTTTFGINVPEIMGEDCPTFCGGILGLQSDIVGTPASASDLDFDVVSLDGDNIRGARGAWKKFSETVPRNMSVVDLRTDTSVDREFSAASFFDAYDDRRNKPLNRKRSSSGGHRVTRVQSDCNLLADDRPLKLPDVIEENTELERKDSIDDYLSFLHEENRTQHLLINTTKKKIRERPGPSVIYPRDQTYSRQYSDIYLPSGKGSLSTSSHYRKNIGSPSFSDIAKNESSFSKETCMVIQMLKERERSPKLSAIEVKAPRGSRVKSFFVWLGQRCGINKDVAENYAPLKTKLFNKRAAKKVPDKIDDSVYTAGASAHNRRNIYEGKSSGAIPQDEPATDAHGYYIFPSTPADDAMVRQATKKVLCNSVYKLSDVTDFTKLLTASGIAEVKRILWCLNISFSSKVEFMPIIPSLCCLLLVYMTPEAAICVLHCLMVRAVETGNLEYGHRFLFIDREGFTNLITYVHSVMKYHLRRLVGKMQLLKVDIAAWIARSVQSGFSQLLPFDFILRIYGDFLFEGEIVLCRYCVALVMYAQAKLMKCNTRQQAEETLYRIGLDEELDIDQLTKLAYSFRIKYYKSEVKRGVITPYLMPVKIKTFYRPRLSSTSSIVREHKWETIWDWLLPAYRILDPQKIYSSEQHGTSLLGLIKKIKESGCVEVAALLFIETTANDIFGVFIPAMSSQATDGHFTSQKVSYQLSSFVFTLKPDEEVFKWSGRNTSSIKIGVQQITVGNDMPALILDKELDQGLSQACASYNSPSLVASSKGHFEVLKIELWHLV
ncbi:hypothetical protein BgAZ_300760 [Babesia gibsoni]|uniref:TLDc domain-containing protein n=1 Tax=Babesia gibsoni TaxID=33632 RepID=A0AAD8LJG2_BABGI|nr:hypothetical protein BgAZ_300760 [Babesia gibsoni]